MEAKIKFLPDISQVSNMLQAALVHQHLRSNRMKKMNMEKNKRNKRNKNIRELMVKRKSMSMSNNKNKKPRKEKLLCRSPSHLKCQKMERISRRSTKQA